jgi:plasmid replication initiation protein
MSQLALISPKKPSKIPLKYNIALEINIINASYKLLPSEKSLLYILLSKINNKEILPDQWYGVTVEEYAKIKNIKRSAAYLALNRAGNSLWEKELRFKNPENKFNLERHRWFSSSRFNTIEQSLEVKFGGAIIPYIGILPRYYGLKLQEVGGLKYILSGRLLELASEKRYFANTGEVKIEFGILLDMIEAENSYREFKVFKAKMLLPAIDELNKLVVNGKSVIYIELLTGAGKLRTRNVEFIEYKFTWMDRLNLKVNTDD